MRLRSKLISPLLAWMAMSSAASAAVIGGSYYAPQYDYSEFFAATDGRDFQVILNGVPALPGATPNDVANALLPLMQAAKPRPALTFTYADPPERPRPYYRLVLTFDPANDYASSQVCAGVPPRFKPGTPGLFYVFAVYCRNDQVLTETTAWTPANAPNDPRIAELFRQLFPVIFPDSIYRHLKGRPPAASRGGFHGFLSVRSGLKPEERGKMRPLGTYLQES